MTAPEVIAVLVGLPMKAIGRRPSSIVSARGYSTLAMATRATTLSPTTKDGFGLFGLFNSLTIGGY